MILPPLKKTYQDRIVLDLPEMELPEGKVIAVFGHNGSGKSTFGKILAGIIPADEKVRIPEEYRVGYMSQTALPFLLSVKKNLMLNADRGKSKQENEARAMELLSFLGLEAYAGKNAKKLSGGETQRMALARILMKPYDLLILDEPTASLDREGIPLAEELIRRYHEETEGTILLITHSKEQAERMAGETLYLEDGKLKNKES